MDSAVADRLLLSIDSDRFVILCGAGLSMAQPSNLPSAAQLAHICSNEYQRITGNQLRPNITDDLEQIAEHFKRNNQFRHVFIERLVPWDIFTRNPNSGHFAIADFLVSGVTEYGVTTNLDTLIEVAAYHLGETDLCATVKHNDPYRGNLKHRQLVKLHGCCRIDRNNTVWCLSQTQELPVEKRIESFSTWMNVNLHERDLLIIGFWSDWSYLNRTFEECMSDVEPRTVILVAPSSSAELETKAPDLWNWANNGGVTFFHVQESGDQFLNELRQLVSKRWLEDIIERSKELYEDITGNAYNEPINLPGNLSTIDLYHLRQDFCGVPKSLIPVYVRNDNNPRLVGAFHLLLLSNGAQISGPFYLWQGRQLRLIEASGKSMSKMRRDFSAELPMDDVSTICVGAFDDGAPANIVRQGSQGNILRNDPCKDWETHENIQNQITGGGP